MLLREWSLSIDYTQVQVCHTGHPAPGRLWTDAHVAQGFAWAPGAVSFGVPDHDGECRLRIRRVDHFELGAEAIWAIQVPFEVTGPLEVGSIFGGEPVLVPEGRYALVLEALPGAGDAERPEEAYVLNLLFLPDAAPSFRILKQGGDVTAAEVLRTDSEPA